MKLAWTLACVETRGPTVDTEVLQLGAVGLVEELGSLDDNGINLSTALCQRAAREQRRRRGEGGCHAEASHRCKMSWR